MQARVHGPPHWWQSCMVTCDGKVMPRVVYADSDKGIVMGYAGNANGRPYIDRWNDDVARYVVCGHVRIYRCVAETPAPPTGRGGSNP